MNLQTIPTLAQPCTECQAGQMHRTTLTYFTWLADELITVPNFPAWICDVCGKREYDPHAINELNLLLNPNAGKSPRKITRPQRNPTVSKSQQASPD